MRDRWAARIYGHALGAWNGSSILRFARRSPGPALLLAAFLAAAFSTAWLVLQTPNFFSGYDFMRMHFFYKSYYRESLLAGRLPLWNPYVGLGRPFMADIETATLYPPNLLVLCFGVYGGMALSVLLHQALAIYGGVRLGRTLGAGQAASWLLGAGIALGGPFSARLSVGIIEGYFTLCWFPALLWLGARLQDRWDAGAAAAFALSAALAILAGQPPLLFVVLLGLVVFLALRQGWPRGAADWRQALKSTAGLLAAGALGAGLAAAALLPFLELVGQGNRPLSSAGFALANGMPAPSWLSLVVPASAAFAPNWEYDLHCGLVPLFAALGGVALWRDRNVRALLGMGLVGALLAAGDRGPFLGWMLHVIPGASALRIPSRYGILFAVSLLGIGAVSLSRRPGRQALLLVPAFLVGAAWVVWLRPHLMAGAGEASRYVLVHVAVLAASALLVGLWQSRGSGVVAALLGVLCAANWLWAIALQAPVYSAYGFNTAEKAVRAELESRGLLRPGAAPARIAFDPSDLCENAGMTEGFSTYNSYVAPSLLRTWEYLHAAASLPVSKTDFIRMPEALRSAPVRWDALNLVATLDHETRALAIEPGPDPRAYVVFDAERVPDAQTAVERMAQRHDFHRKALLEEGTAPGFRPAVGRPASSAAITGFEPERIVVRTSAAAPGILVVAEAWYPGWRATVDGRPADVFPVNGWMRGTVVPAGESLVTLEFRSRTLAAGAGISLLSAALLAALVAGWVPRGWRPQTDSRIL